MLMPSGIRLPHLQLLTAIGSKYMSGIIPMYVRIVIKKLWIISLELEEEAMTGWVVFGRRWR